MKTNQNYLSQHLIIAYLALLVLVSGACMVLMNKTNKILEETQSLYLHPFKVSNTMQQIQNNMLRIDNSMKDLLQVDSVLQRAQTELLIANYDEDIETAFIVIRERFLGNKQRVEDVYNQYHQWRKIRLEIIELVRNEQLDSAHELLRSRSVDHLKKIESVSEYLVNFAFNKADFFLNSAEHQERSIDFWAAVFIMLSFILAIYIWFTMKNLLQLQTAVHESEDSSDQAC
jgi:hypothetical protein